MCYLVEAQVGTIIPKGLLSNGLTEFGVARPRIKSRVRLFFFRPACGNAGLSLQSGYDFT